MPFRKCTAYTQGFWSPFFVCRDPEDTTTLSLLFANQTEDDILLRWMKFWSFFMLDAVVRSLSFKLNCTVELFFVVLCKGKMRGEYREGMMNGVSTTLRFKPFLLWSGRSWKPLLPNIRIGSRSGTHWTVPVQVRPLFFPVVHFNFNLL
jgi:hypothetical protein